MIQFAQPVFLWALTALAVPIGIHLLSRKEGKVIKIGSLRHLHETSTQQFRGIRLNEILLLTLRCLLLTLFVFMLSGLHWKDEGAQHWVLVEEGLQQHPKVKAQTDSLAANGFDVHVWQKGFPTPDENNTSEDINHWQLLHDLADKNLERAIVFSESKAEDFNGLRISAPSFVTWISIPAKNNQFVAYAIKDEGNLLVRQGYSQSDKTYFETKLQQTAPDSVEVMQQKTISVFVAYDADYERDSKIIMASLDAISKTLPVTINVTSGTTEGSLQKADWYIWLSDKKLQAPDSVKIIAMNPHPANELITQTNPTAWALNKKLTVEIARKENLVVKLATLIVPQKEFSTSVAKNDRRILADSIVMAGITPAFLNGEEKSEASVAWWLAVLFLLVLIVERIVAYTRNQ